MARSQFDTPEFKRLRREWYAKAEASGFRDIEVLDDGGEESGLLRGMSVGDLNREGRPLYDAGDEEYYSLARAHVHRIENRVSVGRYRGNSTLAANERALAAWSLHAEGLEGPAIGARLDVSAKVVRRILRQERARMFAALRRDSASETD